MQPMTRTLLPGVVAVAALAGGVTPVQAQDDPIKVGVVTPHSPPGSLSQGSEGRIGVELAAELINEQGGLLGRRIELIHQDSRGIPEEGRSAVERLISRDQVDLLVGGVHSSVCMAMSEVVHDHGEVFMNVNCWSDAIREKGYAEWWNTSISNSRIAVGGAESIAALGAESVHAFAENTDFGIGLAEKLETHLQEIAPEVDYEFQVTDRESKDFSSQIVALRSDPPDVVVTIKDPPAGYIIINQLYEQGIAPSRDTVLLDLDALAGLPDFWDNVDEGGVGMAGFVLYHPNLQLTGLGDQVVEMRRALDGEEPSRLVFQGFDALWTLADAVERAGTLEDAAVIEALRETELTGTRGTITFELEKGPFFQQWVDVPYAVIQYREQDQALGDAPIIAPPAQKTDDYRPPQN